MFLFEMVKAQKYLFIVTDGLLHRTFEGFSKLFAKELHNANHIQNCSIGNRWFPYGTKIIMVPFPAPILGPLGC